MSKFRVKIPRRVSFIALEGHPFADFRRKTSTDVKAGGFTGRPCSMVAMVRTACRLVRWLDTTIKNG